MPLVDYQYAKIVERIKRVVDASPKELKDIQEEVHISADQWSRKMRVNAQGTGGTKTSFNYEEYSRLANYFGAPDGWPFVDWDRAAAQDKALEILAKLVERPLETPTEAPPGDPSEAPDSGRRRGRKSGGRK